MAKKEKKEVIHQKFNQELSLPDQIEEFSASENDVEESYELKYKEEVKSKVKKKPKTEKVKSMPQTYVEDTFDIEDTANNQNEVVIENNVREKTKQFITVEELLVDQRFKNKLDGYKSRIEFDRSFKEILDLSRFSKMTRVYHIDDETDDVDILIHEIVKHFRIKLTKVRLSYVDYQEIDKFFTSLKTIYNRFNNSEYAKKDELREELEHLIEMDSFVKKKLW